MVRKIRHQGSAELIIVGDAFGLWEITEYERLEKLQWLIESHQDLFNQFLKTSQTTPITLIPGNHDYELACYPEFIPVLQQYGIQLVPEAHIIRTLAGKKIWIEHGNQHDGFNRFKYYGDPASTPVGYYITSQFVGGAGQRSQKGHDHWLKDIQAVYPTEHIPHWVFSNYFYREMSPLLRYLLLPFLLLFSLSVIVVILSIIDHQGLLPVNISELNWLRQIGGIGKLLEWVILANSTVISFLLLMAIPLFFIVRDIKATLRRYHLTGHEKAVTEKDCHYYQAAHNIFNSDPDVHVFVYGHTHNASLIVEQNRAIINTGTWIKLLSRVSARARLLPDVYVPSYCLSVFHIKEEQGKLIICYRSREKKPDRKLTRLQRILTFRRRPKAQPEIPSVTVLD